METKCAPLHKKVDCEALNNRFLMFFAFLFIGSFLLAFFYLPIVKIFRYAFIEGTNLSIEEFSSIFTSSINLSALNFSLLQAMISGLICFVLGFPISFFMAKYTFPGRKMLLNTWLHHQNLALHANNPLYDQFLTHIF